MQSKLKVISCYDDVADNYAAKFRDELSKKHFDRLILKAFASANRDKGRWVDFGCGPGQTTNFLYELGINNIIGTDISSGMVNVAKRLFPDLKFETADMLDLQYSDESFSTAVAFYAIVHFEYPQLEQAFREVHRVLTQKGQFLFSFHVGEEVIHHNTFLEKSVDITFYFFQTERILKLLKAIGFKVIDVLERHPYEEVEYPSRRAYVWVEKG